MTSRWTPERAQEWAGQQPWMCGFNYLPSTALNSTQMWDDATFDAATIEREFGWAKQIGFNACRVFLPFIVWQNDARGFFERFERFLEIADQNGLRVMPIFFDDCAFAGKEPHLGPQDAPVPGLHNSGWTPSPGPKIVDDTSNWKALEDYVFLTVERFKADARVCVWDVFNEPGNEGRGEKSLPLLTAAFEWARSVGASQPLTCGVWDWNLNSLCDVSLSQSDVVSFHLYGSATTSGEWIEKLRADERGANRPIFCTEWMARTLECHFDPILKVWKREQVGNFFWGLVNGATQTHFPWGHPKNGPEPSTWFHDLLRRDGSAYDEEELAFVRRVLAEK